MSRLLIDLHQILRPICQEHMQRALHDPLLISRGYAPLLEETWREDSAQRVAWQKGRNAAGEIIDAKAVVTNGRPGQSWHNVTLPGGIRASLAYHLALERQGRLVGFPEGPPMDDEAYLIIGVIGEGLGLVWGGRWRHPHDPMHYEYHPNGATLRTVLAVIEAHGNIDPLVMA